MSVLTKLMDARLKLYGTEIKKTGHNKFAGYQYFELGDFLIPIQKIFSELKLFGQVSFGLELATLKITDIEDNSFIEITSPMSSAALKGCHEVQNLGAVQTYLRRYLWIAALEIVEHDALDATTGRSDPEPKAPPNTAREVAGDEFRALSSDMQIWICDLAGEVEALMAKEGSEQAYQHVEENKLDNDAKMALWYKLESKTRAALKKCAREKNGTPKAAGN